MALFDVYKPFRNRIATLDYCEAFEVLWAYAQYWQVNEFEMPPGIEAHQDFLNNRLTQPYIWQVERLARETVLHGKTGADRERTLRTWKTLAETINAMRGVDDAIYESIVPQQRVLHEMIRIAHEQFPWSGGPTIRTAARYRRIYDREKIRTLFLNETGLELDKCFLIGMGLWGHFARQPFITANIDVEVRCITQADMSSALALFGKGIDELRDLVKKTHKIDETYPYQFNHLRAHPLIKVARMGREFYACPIPTLLFWRFTSGIYYDLVGKNNEFGEELGSSFADYVGETLRRAVVGSDLVVIEEARYQGGRGEERTADWFVAGANVSPAAFIECKTKRLRHNAKANIINTEVFEEDVSALADAVIQLYRTIVDHEAGRYPNLAFDAARQLYPVVVTMEEWYPFGEVRSRLHERVQAKAVDAGLEDLPRRMPFSVMSSIEIEKAAQLWPIVGLRDFFEPFLREERYRGWVIGTYIADRFAEHRLRTLFDDEFNVRLDAMVTPAAA